MKKRGKQVILFVKARHGYFNKRLGKNGVSPVVATVLLITLVVVLALIIFLWAQSFLGEQVEKFGSKVEDACVNVDFDVELVELGVVDELEIVNRGNVPIGSFDVKAVKGGNSDIKNFAFGVDVGGSVRERFSLSQLDLSDPEKLVVYPVLIGTVKGKSKNQPFTCIDDGVVINL